MICVGRSSPREQPKEQTRTLYYYRQRYIHTSYRILRTARNQRVQRSYVHDRLYVRFGQFIESKNNRGGEPGKDVVSPSDIRRCHDQRWQANEGTRRGLGPEHRHCTIVGTKRRDDTKCTTSFCELGVAYYSSNVSSDQTR